MNTPPFNWWPVPEMGIPDAISQALNDIIAEHFWARLAQLNANVADLMTIFEIETNLEDQFSYGSLEFTSAQANFI